MPNIKNNKKEITIFLKSVIDLVNLADKNGVKDATKRIKMFSMHEVDATRNQIISIICEEVSKYYLVSIEALRFGTKYMYDEMRLITYKLLYTHTDMTIREIANYFTKTEQWVQRKLASFKTLNAEVTCDRETLAQYDKILKRVSCRVESLTKNAACDKEDSCE